MTPSPPGTGGESWGEGGAVAFPNPDDASPNGPRFDAGVRELRDALRGERVYIRMMSYCSCV
jgi:hypothetical protein